MKAIITISILLLAQFVAAQSGTITTKDGNTQPVTVQAISDKQLMCKEGNYYLSTITQVDFEKAKISQSLIQRLLNAGIIVNIADEVSKPAASPIMVNEPAPKPTDLQVVIDSIEKFRIQRNAGKAMQLIGVIGSMVATGVSLNGTQIDPAVYFVFAGIGGVGFIVDMDASRHLKIKR